MAAKAHIYIISSGPIAINCPRRIVYYLDGLSHSIIIDYVLLYKILCDRSVLLTVILKNGCQGSHRHYFEWPHS